MGANGNALFTPIAFASDGWMMTGRDFPPFSCTLSTQIKSLIFRSKSMFSPPILRRTAPEPLLHPLYKGSSISCISSSWKPASMLEVLATTTTTENTDLWLRMYVCWYW